jgi:hypothetical protein
MLRLWARNGEGVWVAVTTDPSGDNSQVYLTNLCQVLLLNRNESPMFADYGIPDQPTIAQQLFPDIYVWQTQQQFAPYFAALLISREAGPPPSYTVQATTKAGAVLTGKVLY